MNIADLIHRHAAERPGAPAIVEGDRVITYRSLDELIRQAASQLRSVGIGPGAPVGIRLGDNADHLIMLLALAFAGIASIPIDWRSTNDEWTEISREQQLQCSLVPPGTAAPPGVTTLAIDEAWWAAAASRPVVHESSGDGATPFLMARSSGTTGVAGTATITHFDYCCRLARYWLSYGSVSEHRYLSATPLYFSAGRNYCLLHLLNGGTVIVFRTLFDPTEYVRAVVEHRATSAFLVPTALRLMLEMPHSGKPALEGIEMLVTGADVMFAEEKRLVAERLCSALYGSYSISNTGQIAVLRPEEIARHAESVGRPNLLTETAVLDEEFVVLPPGSVGRLCIRGPGIVRVRYPEGSGRDDGMRQDGWYETGDLARFDDTGYLFLAGRVSDLIIRGGVNVHPIEVERVLLEHRSIAEAAVVGEPSEMFGQEIAAFVVASEPVSEEALRSHCRTRLSHYKLPRRIVFVDELPKTRAGKVRRRELG